MSVRQLLTERHNSNSYSNKKMKEYFIHGVPFVIVHEPDYSKVNPEAVIQRVEDMIPPQLVEGLDGFYMAHLKEFDELNRNAVFKDNTIYITNKQDDFEDMLDDIVHELAHFTEIKFQDHIYGDGEIRDHFINKRYNLYNNLTSAGYDCDKKAFLKVEFNPNLDVFFHEEVGYSKLRGHLGGFPSPYSAASLREYYAVVFTDYFCYDREEVCRKCPEVCDKIHSLLN
jgi:hypothetical protein